MSLTNVSKPTTTLTNTDKASFGETWDNNDETWDQDTQTWDQSGSLMSNVMGPVTVIQIANLTYASGVPIYNYILTGSGAFANLTPTSYMVVTITDGTNTMAFTGITKLSNSQLNMATHVSGSGISDFATVTMTTMIYANLTNVAKP